MAKTRTTQAQFKHFCDRCDYYAGLMAPEWRIRYVHHVDDDDNAAEVGRNNAGMFAEIGFAATLNHLPTDEEIDHLAFDEIMHLVTNHIEWQLANMACLGEEAVNGLMHALTNCVYKAVKA